MVKPPSAAEPVPNADPLTPQFEAISRPGLVMIQGAVSVNTPQPVMVPPRLPLKNACAAVKTASAAATPVGSAPLATRSNCELSGEVTHVGQSIVPAVVIVPPVSGPAAVIEVTVPLPPTEAHLRPLVCAESAINTWPLVPTVTRFMAVPSVDQRSPRCCKGVCAF